MILGNIRFIPPYGGRLVGEFRAFESLINILINGIRHTNCLVLTKKEETDILRALCKYLSNAHN